MLSKESNLTSQKNIRKKLRNSATVQEIILWSRLRRNQMGCKFRRQNSFGRYVVDFYCPSKNLVIELDGWQHGQNIQENYDKERTLYLKSLGLNVLRFWNNEVNDELDGVILRIQEYL
jgi:very-short-patch-repair endonuclease